MLSQATSAVSAHVAVMRLHMSSSGSGVGQQHCFEREQG